MIFCHESLSQTASQFLLGLVAQTMTNNNTNNQSTPSTSAFFDRVGHVFGSLGGTTDRNATLQHINIRKKCTPTPTETPSQWSLQRQQVYRPGNAHQGVSSDEEDAGGLLYTCGHMFHSCLSNVHVSTQRWTRFRPGWLMKMSCNVQSCRMYMACSPPWRIARCALDSVQHVLVQHSKCKPY